MTTPGKGVEEHVDLVIDIEVTFLVDFFATHIKVIRMHAAADERMLQLVPSLGVGV